MMGHNTIVRDVYDLFQNNSVFQFLCVFCTILISAHLVIQFGLKKRIKFPPGPRGLPFFGYFPFMGKEHHKTVARLARYYGPVVSVPLGASRVVFVNDWEGVKEAFGNNAILSRSIDKHYMPRGLGFAVTNGPEWLEQRRFSMKVIKDIGLGRPKWENLLCEEIDELLQELEKHRGEPVDPMPLFESSFLNNLLTLTFGQRLRLGYKEVKYIGEMMDVTMTSIAPTALSNFLPRLSKGLHALGLYASDNKKKLEEYDQFIRDLVDKRLQQKYGDDEDSFVNVYAEEIQNKQKKGLKTTLTEDSLYDNLQILLLGGNETARSSLLWLLIAMAENQAMQERVQMELAAGDINCWADRAKAPYTLACIMEGQRWRTLIPVPLFRTTNEDTTILGYDIPKGTAIGANSWALHNDPKYWPNPEKFDPTRMLTGDGKQIITKPDSYNPFSFGRRNCPGETIAMMQLLLYFTKIMQKFTVRPEEGNTVKHDEGLYISYYPCNFKLRFVPRGKN